MSGCYRTASGSDRIIFHFPFNISHLASVEGVMRNRDSQEKIWKMTNDKWQMIPSLPLPVLERAMQDQPCSRRSLFLVGPPWRRDGAAQVVHFSSYGGNLTSDPCF